MSCRIVMALVVLCLSTLWPHPAASGDGGARPTQVITYVASADAVLSDLEYMVVELARQPKIWDDKVLPNIEIFLIGIDPSLPLRFDSLLDRETGRRSLFMLPMDGDTRLFLNENLDPIGVFSKPTSLVGRPPRAVEWELYSDPAAPIFDGWMRYAHGYGFISKERQDVPESIVAPSQSHGHLEDLGVDLAIQLLTPQENEADRMGAFNRYRENVVSGLEKYDDESDNAFALRQLTVEQQFVRMEVLFMQTSELSAMWTLSEGQGVLDVVVAPLAETQLATDFLATRDRESVFARIPLQTGGVASGRLNILLSETLRAQFGEFYHTSIPVVLEDIDANENFDAAQKEARKQAAELILNLLADNALDGNVDAFVEVYSAGEHHTLVMGLLTVNTDPVLEVLQAVARFGDGWSLTENVETIDAVNVHQIQAGSGYPQALKDFFGDSGLFYVGVDESRVWIAAGIDALDSLKTAIAQTTDDSLPALDVPLLQLDFQAYPILKVTHQWAEESSLDLVSFLKKGGLTNYQPQEQRATRSNGNSNDEPLMSAFRDFDWQSVALNVLKGSTDRIEILYSLDDDARLTGVTRIETDILKAVGMVIARFADEQL